MLPSLGYTWGRAADVRIEMCLHLRCIPVSVNEFLGNTDTCVNRKKRNHCGIDKKINNFKKYAYIGKEIEIKGILSEQKQRRTGSGTGKMKEKTGKEEVEETEISM